MTTANCIDCRQPFTREPGETWRVRCYSCWRKSKTPKAYQGNRDTGIDERVIVAQKLHILRLELELDAARAELTEHRAHVCPAIARNSPLTDPANLRALRRLVHPDRHGGSEAATRLSQLVNAEIRRSL